MKNSIRISFIIAVSFLLVLSCNRNNSSITIDRVGIDSLGIVSDTIQLGDLQNIPTYTTLRWGCEGSYGYDVENVGYEREIVAMKFIIDEQCTQPKAVKNILRFVPQERGIYNLKFWKKDNVYITKKIVVK